MKYAATMTMALLIAIIGCAQSPPESLATSSPGGSSGKPQPKAAQTVTARVTSVADSTKMRMLVWVVTFQEKDGTLHKCLVRPRGEFFRAMGLEKLTYKEISERKDYSALPWYEIVIGAKTEQYGKLISWKEIKKDAEPPAGGDGRPAP